MIERRRALSCLALIALMCLGSAFLVVALPHHARIPVHFGLDGRPNGRADKWLVALGMPAVAALMLALVALIARADPRAEKLAQAKAALGTVMVAATLILALVHAQLIAGGLGLAPFSVGNLAAILGLFFIITGNELGKLPWNFTVGIRTPWTLSDERVWDRTHRFGGPVFVASGVLMIVTGLVAPDGMAQGVAILAITGAAVLAVMVKSYLLWRHRAM